MNIALRGISDPVRVFRTDPTGSITGSRSKLFDKPDPDPQPKLPILNDNSFIAP